MTEISLKVIFNDVDLAQWITVTKGFTRGIRGEKEITTTNVGNSNGSILLSERYLEKTISMPFVVLKLTLKKQRELSAVLNVDEPKRLIFGDDPDKYYMAMPAQAIDFDELRTYGSGKIDWLCLEPYAFAVGEKTFTNVGNTITVKNNGTYPTPVSFNIESQSDNGFVG
ncbi:phage tail family protein, partial [Latilactobacillus curvatus]|nr:phage tail family protein [Latilactobacillus curvatus]MCM6861732.1 phage tail family protein [Latilactobacillus curvatus]